MESSTQEKNLPATPRRLQKARQDGQVPRAKDLSNLAVLGGGMVLLFVLVPWGYERLRHAMRLTLSFDQDLIRHPGLILEVLVLASTEALMFFLPLGIVLALVVSLSQIAVGSFAWSAKPLVPDISKIGVISGFKRLFSKQQLVEILKLLVITVLLAIVASVFVSKHMVEFGTLLLRPLESSLSQLGRWFVVGVGGLLTVVLLVALIDVPLQQYLHQNQLKMSLKEVRDEHKETEGNPQLKGKLRQRQREIAQGNSVSRVPAADLVVMNPTHYAVALKYDALKTAAPVVLAKGADLMALRIRDAAQAASVPVLQAPPLARALYAHAEVDREIPAALFAAVAQVLAWVYQLRNAMAGKGQSPAPLGDVPVPPDLDPQLREAARAAGGLA